MKKNLCGDVRQPRRVRELCGKSTGRESVRELCQIQGLAALLPGRWRSALGQPDSGPAGLRDGADHARAADTRLTRQKPR
jgi:hypothetical protein